LKRQRADARRCRRSTQEAPKGKESFTDRN
jgi:hypothetical protein